MTNQVTAPAAPVQTKRIYSVRNVIDGSVRLVLAVNAAQASRHVAKDTLDVTIPTTVQALEINKANPNIEIEEA
jgi:hypothetical protein